MFGLKIPEILKKFDGYRVCLFQLLQDTMAQYMMLFVTHNKVPCLWVVRRTEECYCGMYENQNQQN